MYAAQYQRPLRLRRQSRDRLRQTPQGVTVSADLLRRRRLIRQVVIHAFQSLERHDTRSLNMAHDQGPRDLEEAALGMADIIDPSPRCQQAIGLLYQIVRIDAGNASPQQPGPKRWFMRQYLAQQPARPPLIEMMAH